MTRKRQIRRRRPGSAQTARPTAQATSAAAEVPRAETLAPAPRPRQTGLADLLAREAGHHAAPAVPPQDDPATLVPAPSPEARADDGAKPPLDDALTDTIRRWARTTTPQELEERGVKRVRSVSMSRMAALIEKAVNKVLISRTLDGGTEEALSLSSSARKEFLRLARGEMQPRDDTARRSRATSTLDRLRLELAERRKELAAKEHEVASAAAATGGANAALEERLRELFAVHSTGRDRELETETLAVVQREMEAVRRRAREEQLAESKRDVEQLERRISKLSVLLGETEEELRRARARRTIDAGVASIYDGVQGLDSGDSRFEQKADLMKSIFEANLALRN